MDYKYILVTVINNNMEQKNNTGVENSGDWNSGHWNSGDWNSGDWNSGDRNSGDWNSGHRNSGYRNSGHWNSGDWNSGHFNTGSPDKIMVFNKWVEMTNDEFEDKYNIFADIPLNRWVYEKDMTEQELKDFPKAKQMGGYLKKLPFKEACVIWWEENPKRHKDFLELPHFDKDIFFEITGIEVDKEIVKTMNKDKVLKYIREQIPELEIIGHPVDLRHVLQVLYSKITEMTQDEKEEAVYLWERFDLTKSLEDQNEVFFTSLAKILDI